jgi:hypothetical protein
MTASDLELWTEDEIEYAAIPPNETAAIWINHFGLDLDRMTIDDLVHHVKAMQQDRDIARHASTGNMDEAPF